MSSERFIKPKDETPASSESISEVKERVRDIPVCIVIPPSPFLTDERVFPSLGPIKVATELQGNRNPISVMDLSGVGNYEELIRDYASSNPGMVFGISATTPQMPFATNISRAIKEGDPGSKLILGGPHATLVHAAAKRDLQLNQIRRGTIAFSGLERDFDKIVAGDGELAVFYALDPSNDDFVIDASQRKSPLFLQRGTLDDYMLPNRDFLSLRDYKFYIEDDGQKYRSTSVIAQLGCPYRCGFCGGRDVDSFRIARSRSVPSIIEEIEQILRVSGDWEDPIRGVMFYDDELNINDGALRQLCSQLTNIQECNGIGMRFRGFVRADLFTTAQAKAMYDAGFRVILSGVESGSGEILRAMNKHTDPDINSRMVQIAHENGLRVKALMSVGHPGETAQSVRESVDWVRGSLRPDWDDVDWTVITQFPGSPYFDESIFVPNENAWVYVDPRTKSRLWSGQMDYSRDVGAYKGIPGEYIAYVWTDDLTSEALVRERDEAERLTREYLNLPSLESTPRKNIEHSMGQMPSNILRTAN